MNYGKLSHGIVDVDQPQDIKISDGVDADRPDDPKTGDIRYNHERLAIGLGTNSGAGQYEIYKNGGWFTLMTEMDFVDAKDVKNKETISDNVIFKMISKTLKDTFITAMGNITLLQESNWAYMAPWAMGHHQKTDAERKKYWPGEKTVFTGDLASRKLQSNMEGDPSNRRLPSYLQDMQYKGWGDGNGYTPTMIVGDKSGNNLVGAFKAFIGKGRVYDVNVEESGSGYSHVNPPQLLFNTRGGSGAVLRATVVAGVITQVDVLAQGSGYRSAHILVIERGALAREYAQFQINTESDGQGLLKIVSVSVTHGGSAYEKTPDLFISDGGHGAVVEPIMSPDGQQLGKIQDTKLLSSGWDFSVTPDIIVKSSVEPTTPARLTCVIGENQLLAIAMMKPIPSNYQYDGTVDLVISGGDPDVAAEAHMVIKNGVGVDVVLTNTGKNYQSEPTVTLPMSFTNPTTDVTVLSRSLANQSLDFKFNIFQACGVPLVNKHMYDISLLTNLTSTMPMLSPYANQTARMMVKFTPQWAPFDNYSHNKYGEYSCNISLYGQRSYYASGVGTAWRAEVTKSRS